MQGNSTRTGHNLRNTCRAYRQLTKGCGSGASLSTEGILTEAKLAVEGKLGKQNSCLCKTRVWAELVQAAASVCFAFLKLFLLIYTMVMQCLRPVSVHKNVQQIYAMLCRSLQLRSLNKVFCCTRPCLSCLSCQFVSGTFHSLT